MLSCRLSIEKSKNMSYITKEYFQFFKKLANNNDRDWFNTHKEHYLQVVYNPFKYLTETVIEKMNDIDPNIQISSKEAMFRIYRDVRFSKNKEPYKLWLGAAVSRSGRKNAQYPEIYFHFGHDESFIAAGLYRPDKETLHKIRMAIAGNPDAFKKVKNSSTMHSIFPNGILGERNKRLAKEFMQVSEDEPFILNKQFYTIKKFTQKEIVNQNNLPDFIVKHYLAMQDFNQYLLEIL